MNRKKSGGILALIIVIIAALGILAVNGARIGKWQIKPLWTGVNLGLDLRGGVYAVYQAKNTNVKDLDSKMNSAVSVFRNRLDAKGYTEATITRQGTDRIRIEVPEINDPNELFNIIGKPAKLEFIDPNGKVVVEGKEVVSAKPAYGEGNQPFVEFELNSSGTSKFAKATSEFQGKIIRIVLDGKDIQTPTVNTVIPNGKGEIEGSKTIDEAKNLAMLISSGSLPLDLTILETKTMSASLGANALNGSLLAGLIGSIAVMIFMLAFYRLPGLVADMALCVYILLVTACIVFIPGIQLSLPGIAGIILGIGMAVDANVLIFERMKDELRSGRTLRASVDAGFKRAFSAIFDSNVTTVIAAIVLMFFGTGPVKGFAYTLTIGVIASMFTAITVTHYLLRLVMDLNVHNKKLYGL